MRKVFIFSEFPSEKDPAAFSYIRHRVEALKHRFHVTVVTVSRERPNKNTVVTEQADGYRVITLMVKDLGISRVRFFYTEYMVNRLLKSVLKDGKPDLLETHFCDFYSWLAFRQCTSLGIPFVLSEHASYVGKKMKHAYFGPKIRRAYEGAAEITAVSEFLAGRMQKHTKRTIQVIPNIVDTERFSPARRVPGPFPHMISVGVLDEKDKKGIRLLLGALRRLEEKGHLFTCDIVGDGPDRLALQRLCKTYGISKAVRFKGAVPNDKLPAVLNRSDFFVSASRVETFGVAIVEGMSCGLPVVSTKSGGPEEYVTKEIGILCGHSEQKLAAALEKMIRTSGTYNRSTIRQLVLERFSGAVYEKRKTAFYEHVISTYRAGGKKAT
ncbi:hypothetical protein CR205_16115 [Alteribacter lacisalsi]|uniref:Glycosyltransferase family 4 protein n=1 Tax=Alteribacter lacisalsi TaxID=2045244 RepID=A0A2W0H290_9BACI|nr:glycosyltransferase [Alteribacter lacisalsi]PYZ95903.1 hypothetical protein CR205_16115 [Alteribacter lacisalsi]